MLSVNVFNNFTLHVAIYVAIAKIQSVMGVSHLLTLDNCGAF